MLEKVQLQRKTK